MGKYIDADLLRKEIDNWKEAMVDAVGEYSDGVRFALEHFTFVLDSLQQEQPEVDFKIEERKWIHNAVDNVFPEDGDFMSEVDFRKILKDTARHFYELGLNARKEE